LIVLQLPFYLCEGRLKRPRVDLEEGVALANHLPFAVVHTYYLALHTTRYIYRVNGCYYAQGFDVDSNVSLPRRGRVDWYCSDLLRRFGFRGCVVRSLAITVIDQAANEEDCDGQPHPPVALGFVVPIGVSMIR
jgi:hypothetical protein